MKRNNTGFNLIELLVVITIIGVLAGIAYPSYQNQVKRSKRVDAQGALISLKSAMERVFTERGTYKPGGSNPTLGASGIFPSETPIDSSTKLYDLSIAASTSATFTLRATPKNGQAGDGIIELDHTGARRWDKNNDGDTVDSGENNWD